MTHIFYLPGWNWTNHTMKLHSLTSSLLQISMSSSLIDILCTFQSTCGCQGWLDLHMLSMLAWATFKALFTSLKYEPDLGGNFNFLSVLGCGNFQVEGYFWNANSVMLHRSILRKQVSGQRMRAHLRTVLTQGKHSEGNNMAAFTFSSRVSSSSPLLSWQLFTSSPSSPSSLRDFAIFPAFLFSLGYQETKGKRKRFDSEADLTLYLPCLTKMYFKIFSPSLFYLQVSVFHPFRASCSQLPHTSTSQNLWPSPLKQFTGGEW